MAHTIKWEATRVYVSYTGRCQEDEVLSAVIQLQADARFDSIHQYLHDFSECAEMLFSVKYLEELAARNTAAANYNKKLRIAIVTDRPDVIAMVQCFEDIGMNPYPIRIFENIENASAWLNDAPTER